jgi:hypothetical protein
MLYGLGIRAKPHRGSVGIDERAAGVTFNDLGFRVQVS